MGRTHPDKIKRIDPIDFNRLKVCQACLRGEHVSCFGHPYGPPVAGRGCS